MWQYYLRNIEVMILRNKRISTSSDVVQLSVSFGAPDVKSWLKYFAWLCARDTQEGKRQAQSIPLTEFDIRHYLENDPNALKNWESKWRQQLSAWAWATAIRCGYLVQSVTPGKENAFFLADCLFSKVGRPLKDDVD
jgi:hypothetical protein